MVFRNERVARLTQSHACTRTTPRWESAQQTPVHKRPGHSPGRTWERWEGTQPRDLWLEDHCSSRTCENWIDFVDTPGPRAENFVLRELKCDTVCHDLGLF